MHVRGYTYAVCAFTHVWSTFLMHRVHMIPFNDVVNLKYAHLRNWMHTFYGKKGLSFFSSNIKTIE